MSTSARFGTFSGVFTPSILTILGVIMYLRLPWIVGHAGLYQTLGIILIAHIISVTTGLSVASISTDKKVQAGGNYYIISRSLGLPIGGTLGIALFVGFSFSVSLYIIGFSESFLGYLELPLTLENIRFYGTLILLAVTLVTLISTSLAIRLQYLIMLAIALSLLAVFFGNNTHVPAEPSLFAQSDAIPLTVLFGIFFPAVTGFTTGVQMSGDLQDPKRSLPRGTMAAIAVGFIVYIALAVFLAWRIEPEQLRSNTGILADIAWFVPFLIAGIWGATISSAMGSILGAPRILQATSRDRITPRFFARGYGPGNDPHNALLLTFVIAEIGILVGELNLIARIVSIFFITTYGFINLVCALENWAGPDFRPSFRIPSWIAVVGAGFCFFVMYELDPLALLGAIVLLGLLYAFLKRRELTLESGDTWEGIWSSVVRSGLQYLTRIRSHQRNWRPNILLFSGGNRVRPHLVEFGTWLVDKRGILTNFDLIENPQADALFSRSIQPEHDESTVNNGLFSRQLECRNMYEGIENIARIYGFSGIDPNTIMMGWGRNSRAPQRFAEMIHTLMQLDYNILLLDYDREYGFGGKRRIDIWWRGGSNNATLSLTMLRFMQSSEGWSEAEARVLIVVEDSAMSSLVYKNMSDLLEEQRIQATVAVIDNSMERRTFREIIRAESADADLVMMGLTEINPDNAAHFVSGMDALAGELGNVLMVHASSYFDAIFIGIEKQAQLPAAPPAEAMHPSTDDMPLLQLQQESNLSHQLQQYYIDIHAALQQHHQRMEPLGRAFPENLLEGLRELSNTCFSLASNPSQEGRQPNGASSYPLHSEFLSRAQHLFQELERKELPILRESWVRHGGQLIADMERILAQLPAQLKRFYRDEELAAQPGDDVQLTFFKWRKRQRLQWLKQPIRERFNWRALLERAHVPFLSDSLYRQQEHFGSACYEVIRGLQTWIGKASDILLELEKQAAEGPLDPLEAENRNRELQQILRNLHKTWQEELRREQQTLLVENRDMLQKVALLLEKPLIQREAGRLIAATSGRHPIRHLLVGPGLWYRNLTLLNHFTLMAIQLRATRGRLSDISANLRTEMQQLLQSQLQNPFDDLYAFLQSGQNNPAGKPPARWTGDSRPHFDNTDIMQRLVRSIRLALAEVEESVAILTAPAFQELDQRQFGELVTMDIHLRRWLNQLIDGEYSGMLQDKLAETARVVGNTWTSGYDIVRSLFPQHDSPGGLTPVETERPELSEQALTHVARERAMIEEQLAGIDRFLQERLTATLDKMHPSVIIHSTANRTTGGRADAGLPGNWLPGSAAFTGQLEAFAGKWLYGNYWQKQWRQWLLVPETNRQNEQRFLVAEALMPDPATLQALSFYYRQLFMGKQMVGADLWEPRDEELLAEKLIKRYKNGMHGGLLITGPGNSGKTSLARRIAQQQFDRKRVYRIAPPPGGSSDSRIFKQVVEETLLQRGSWRRIFEGIPLNSVVFFDDLDLWWEHNTEGLEVLKSCLDIVNRYSDRLFFIASCHTQSARFLRRLLPLDLPFIGEIALQPFTSAGLLHAVLRRHRSTGLTFEIAGITEEKMSRLNMLKLAQGLLQLSGGTIGSALHSWISLIDKVQASQLLLHWPAVPMPDELPLPVESIVWLNQLMVHKQCSRSRLESLLAADSFDAAQQLNYLLRHRFIREARQGLFELNPFLQRAIEQQMDREGLLL